MALAPGWSDTLRERARRPVHRRRGESRSTSQVADEDARANRAGAWTRAVPRAIPSRQTSMSDATGEAQKPSQEQSAASTGRVWTAVALAWLVPGAGHLFLGKRGRAAVFLALVLISAAIGLALQGKLFVVVPEQPLSRLGTIASMGMGPLYFVLRFMVDYQGNILAPTYEYGSAFLLTAGLMNLLLVLDAWDVAQGFKR